ncbi:MAG: hypothetical protein ABSE73_05975 [Planctomycetota bacterium]
MPVLTQGKRGSLTSRDFLDESRRADSTTRHCKPRHSPGKAFLPPQTPLLGFTRKKKKQKTKLKLPCTSTFHYLFKAIDIQAFEWVLTKWLLAQSPADGAQSVANIDGKTLRGSPPLGAHGAASATAGWSAPAPASFASESFRRWLRFFSGSNGIPWTWRWFLKQP